MICVWMLVFVFKFLAYSLDTTHGRTCGNVTQWLNNSSPSLATNFTETEEVPTGKELDNVCGGTAGGVLRARCKDDKGEPFEGVRNESRSLFYIATCTHINGLKCSPYDGYNTSCPDFAIQFYCQCSDVKFSTTTPAAPASTTALHGTSDSSAGLTVIAGSSAASSTKDISTGSTQQTTLHGGSHTPGIHTSTGSTQHLTPSGGSHTHGNPSVTVNPLSAHRCEKSKNGSTRDYLSAPLVLFTMLFVVCL